MVIVDMQNDYCKRDGFFDKVMHKNVQTVMDMVPHLCRTLQKAREIHLERIYIQTIHADYTASNVYKARMGGVAPNFCRPNTWGAEIIEELRPEKDELVIVKHRYSAFIDSEFPLVIRSLGMKNLLFCGTATNVCVESTLRDALMNDYFPILLSDCVAAYELAEHEASLKVISNYFGAVAKSDDVFERLKGVENPPLLPR